jgi:hypothetical protein
MITILATVASVAAAGAWLRWAVIPVKIAYDLGRQVERLCAGSRSSASRHNGITRV